MMTDDEMIAVIQAHKEGKIIQYRPRDSYKDWRDWYNQKEILWGFWCYDYRVKPASKPKFNIGESVSFVDRKETYKISDQEYKDNRWYYILDGDSDWFAEELLCLYIKPTYRPFDSTEEVIAAIKEHGILIKSGEKFHSISTIGHNYIRFNDVNVSFVEALVGGITFADGTPFGKLEE